MPSKSRLTPIQAAEVGEPVVGAALDGREQRLVRTLAGQEQEPTHGQCGLELTSDKSCATFGPPAA
jgi:hypothetical protein